MTMNSIERDLRDRWTPSAEQDERAAEYLRRCNGGDPWAYALTVHLLVGKEPGCWTEDVRVVPVDGVHGTRNEAFDAAEAAVEEHRRQHPGECVSAGYAAHSLPADGVVPRSGERVWKTSWAVFEI